MNNHKGSNLVPMSHNSCIGHVNGEEVAIALQKSRGRTVSIKKFFSNNEASLISSTRKKQETPHLLKLITNSLKLPGLIMTRTPHEYIRRVTYE